MTTLERTRIVRPRTQRTAFIHSFRHLVGRMAAIHVEGQRTHGAGVVLQWDMGHGNRGARFVSLAELGQHEEGALITRLVQACTLDQFVLLIQRPTRSGVIVVDAGAPLPHLYEQWGHTLTPYQRSGH